MKMNSFLLIRLLKHVLYFFSFALVLQTVAAERSSYRAAVFEYHAVGKGSVSEILNKNVDNYILAMKTAKLDKADIIVTPERGVFTLAANKSTLALVATQVPNSKDRIVPCTDTQNNFPKYFKRLSCAARSLSMYLVVNLFEKDSSKGNSPNEERYFDANVVFDRDGTVISSYRKYNAFNTADQDGDNILDKPELEHSTFTTDFGVTFGHFVCFDMLFKSPSRDLVNQGITDFAYPTWWYSQLPFLSAMQIQSAFSKAHKVNVLAANINYPDLGSTGSGIYRIFGSSTRFRNEVPANVLLVSDVHSNANFAPNQDFIKIHRFSTAEMPIEDETSVPEAYWQFNNFTNYKEINLSGDENGRLELDKIVCHNEFCCHFNISGKMLSTLENDESYRYKAVVFKGVTFYEVFRGGIEVCGIVACSNDDITSCGRIKKSARPSVQFDSIVIESKDVPEKVNIFPTTLRFPCLSPMQPYEYSFIRTSAETTLMKLLAGQQKNLFAFAIYGRDESRDN